MNKYYKEDYEKIGELVDCCKSLNEDPIENLISLFSPLLNKYCYLNGKKNEDLHSELIIALLNCVKSFKIDNSKYTLLHQNYYKE